MAVARIADIYILAELYKNVSKLLQREMTLEDLQVMDQDKDDNIGNLRLHKVHFETL